MADFCYKSLAEERTLLEEEAHATLVEAVEARQLSARRKFDISHRVEEGARPEAVADTGDADGRTTVEPRLVAMGSWDPAQEDFVETACRARGSRRSLSITPSFLPHVQCFVNFLVLCRIDRSSRLTALVG